MCFTNTVSVDAYRGAGRPEMAYLIERVVERAAAQGGFDPVELRRRNLIRPAEMPFTNPVGMVFEPADFVAVLDAAAADLQGYPERKRAADARGLLAGRGIAFYVEPTGSGNLTESVQVSVGGSSAAR